MQKAFGSAQGSQFSSRSRDLPLRGALWHGWPVNGISPAAYGRSDSRRSGCCHPFCSRCCRSFEEDFWESIPIAKDRLYELAQRIRSHSRSGQDPGRFKFRGFLFLDLRRSSCDRPRDLDRSGGRYACRRLGSSRRLCLRRCSAAGYAANSLDGARGAHSELRWLRALLPVAKADLPSVSQLRARSCARCRFLSPLWPTANEHGTATLTGRILKNEPTHLGARTLGAERQISHETDHYVDNSVAAFHFIHDASHDRRHPIQDVSRRSRKSVCGARFRSPAIWNAGAQRKAGGIHYHFPLVGPRAGHPCCPHERDAGSSRWRHRQLRPSFPFRVDNARVWHHRDVLHHPVGARTVELALAPVVTRLIRALPAWLGSCPPGKLRCPFGAFGGQALAERLIGGDLVHGLGDGVRVGGVEFESGAGDDPGQRLDFRTGRRHPGGQSLQHREAEAFEEGWIDERPGPRVEVQKRFARNPARKIHGIAEAERIAKGQKLVGEETVDAAHHQAEFGMREAEFGEGPQQAVEVLVRMQRGDGEQKRLGTAAPGEAEEDRFDAQRDYLEFRIGKTVTSPQIGGGGFGIGQNAARDMRRTEQEKLPEREIEPAKVFGMALVLEVVKDGDLRAGTENGRGEAGVEEHV